MDLDYKGRNEERRGKEWARKGRKGGRKREEAGGKKVLCYMACLPLKKKKNYTLFQSGYTFSPAMFERDSFSASLSAFGTSSIFYVSNSDRCMVIVYSDFNFHFPKGKQC